MGVRGECLVILYVHCILLIPRLLWWGNGWEPFRIIERMIIKLGVEAKKVPSV